jgi:diguanylate cyclase (GGDEF)-like protein
VTSEFLSIHRPRKTEVITEEQQHLLEAAERERQYYLQSFKFFVSLTIPVVLLIGLFHLAMGNYSLVASMAAVIVILAGCRLMVTRSRYREAIYIVAVAVLYLHFLRLLYSGAEHGSNLVWMLCFPISSYMLLGRKQGSLALALSLVGILLVFFGPPVGSLEKYAYPAPVITRFLFVYLLVSLFSFWYESIRLNFRNEMEQRHLDLLAAARKIERLSLTDELTGCYNRRYLEQGIRQELDRGRRSSHSLAIVLCDIDNFKSVNDRYGHVFGDQVLTELAARMRDVIRHDVDWIARYGGEEFVIVLPETTLKGADSLAGRIRSSLSSQAFITEDGELNVTASFGVTAVQLEPDLDVSFDDLFSKADRLLYRAKADGRDLIVSAQFEGGPKSASGKSPAPVLHRNHPGTVEQ